VEPLGERFRAFGWEVREVNGHDPTALLSCLLNLPDPGSGRPHLVVAHTVKGKGVEYMEMSRVWHLGYLAPPDAEATIADVADPPDDADHDDDQDQVPTARSRRTRTRRRTPPRARLRPPR
jgi:transketolase